MSTTLDKSRYNIDQPAGFKLLNAGASLALGTATTKAENITETASLNYNSSGPLDLTESIADTISSLTVV